LRELFILFVVACAIVALLSAGASAKPFTSLQLSRATMGEIARVGANEDSRPLRREGTGTSGAVTEDHRGILQTVLAFQRHYGYPSALSAIRALAPHVTRQRDGSARHRAYGNMPAYGVLKPVPWVNEEHGTWELHGPLWATFRDEMIKIGREGFDPPCDGDPIAWGCTPKYKKGCDDDRIALSRGLVPLVCGERNRFWAKPSQTIDASLAAGRELSRK
jgi:hypothetical protein